MMGLQSLFYVAIPVISLMLLLVSGSFTMAAVMANLEMLLSKKCFNISTDFAQIFDFEVNFDVSTSAQACAWIKNDRILHYFAFKWNLRAKIGKLSCKIKKNKYFFDVFGCPAYFGLLVVAFKKF